MTKILFGFHAVTVRLKTAPESVIEIHVDATRRDARMRQFVERAKEAGARVVDSDDERLQKLVGTHRHQGVVAHVKPLALRHSLDDVLDAATGAPLVLVLDGVTDPHNLGACLRVADGAGAHAVVAPKDHAVGINATVAKVASGAAETVPYLMVTNLARSLGELKERDIRIIGTSDDAPRSLYEADLRGPVALVLGAEGTGLRQLTRKTCDELVRIPMQGAVESLNVSVASRRLPVRGAAAAQRVSAMATDAVRVRQRIEAAARVCVLTGAGMSAESGIPTFRDAQTGLWSRFDPMQLASVEGFRADPQLVWDWYAERRAGVRSAQPNAGHVALAAFARAHPGRLTVVTQNVDDLHQRAGVADAIRLHGDILEDRWLDRCPHHAPDDTRGALEGRPPRCAQCGNLVRPGVVWFGEMLPADALEAAEAGCARVRRDGGGGHVRRRVAGRRAGRPRAAGGCARGDREPAAERDRRRGACRASRHRGAAASHAVRSHQALTVNPSRCSSARSRSTSGFPVVSSFSP